MVRSKIVPVVVPRVPVQTGAGNTCTVDPIETHVETRNCRLIFLISSGGRDPLAELLLRARMVCALVRVFDRCFFASSD